MGAALVALAGCGGGGETVDDGDEAAGPSAQGGCDYEGVMTVSPAEVTPGESVSLTVENRAERPSEMTLGASGGLEVAAGERWEPAPDALATKAVRSIGIVVRPGAVGRSPYDAVELTDDAKPGHYRVVKDVNLGRERIRLCAGFTVAG